MSVLEAKLNDSLVKVVQTSREKRYSDAIESLNKLLPLMDKWFHSEPEVHRLYFRTYYRVLKACLYGDLGLYHQLNNDLLSASLALEQSIKILPTHLSLQRLSYLAVQRNDLNSATSHLLCLVSDPLLRYDRITLCRDSCATHPSEALALRAVIIAYCGNIVEGINLISLALSYHSQTAAEIATPTVCAQLRAGIPPRVITKIPDLASMSPAELRKYHLLLRVFVSLCKIAVDRCVKLPIVVNCDIRNILNHVLGEFHKLVISNVIFDPTGLYQVLLDKYLSIGGNPDAVKVCMDNTEYLIDLYSFAFPWVWNVQTVIHSFTCLMKENVFTDTVWTLLSAYDKKASRKATEAGMQALSRKKIIEETSLAEYVSNMYGLQLAPLFTGKSHDKNHINFATILKIAGPREAVKSIISTYPTSESALHTLTHRTPSVSENSFDDCVTETKESLMKAFQEAIQSRKNPGTSRHITVSKSPVVTSTSPIRSMDLSGLHVCPSPAELATSLADTILGQPMAPLDTLWTRYASTCQECRDPKPTYQTRKIINKADLRTCIEGHQSTIQQAVNGAPYSTGLSGIYNGEVERVKNTSVLSRFMLGSTIRAMNESSGEPLKPFSKRCRRLAKTLQSTTQDYDLDTLSEKPNIKFNSIDTIDLPADNPNSDFCTFNLCKKKTVENKMVSATNFKVEQRKERLSVPLTPILRPQSTSVFQLRTSRTKSAQESKNETAKAATRLLEPEKSAFELSMTVLPQQNLLTGKVVLDYITGKEIQQAESIYTNIGLVTAILDRNGSNPVVESPAAISSINLTNSRPSIKRTSSKPTSISLLPDRGAVQVPAYLDIIAYQTAFTPRGTADTIEVSSSVPQPLMTEQVDLFQYCNVEPSRTAGFSEVVSERLENPITPVPIRNPGLCSETTSIDHKHRSRSYHTGLEKYVVEPLPQTPPKAIPKVISNIQPSPRNAPDKKGRRKTVTIDQITPASNACLSHFTGKTISALLIRSKRTKR
ncbi:Hypothetical protein GLP15_791 [Giardia lamblia P15]|uniref:Uncharacterized protein n=1 Tax=Giardia intestinalis (strain P15) TaxID=658858 RepID=E1EXW3_GIAIA|nr:Hypothetical protein GLP15_791 [Giardia lamblia P15]